MSGDSEIILVQEVRLPFIVNHLLQGEDKVGVTLSFLVDDRKQIFDVTTGKSVDQVALAPMLINHRSWSLALATVARELNQCACVHEVLLIISFHPKYVGIATAAFEFGFQALQFVRIDVFDVHVGDTVGALHEYIIVCLQITRMHLL
jgi:hypothetical protein